MLKKRLVQLVVAVALTVAVSGGIDIATDTLGLSVTSQAFASSCNSGGSGGGC